MTGARIGGKSKGGTVTGGISIMKENAGGSSTEGATTSGTSTGGTSTGGTSTIPGGTTLASFIARARAATETGATGHTGASAHCSTSPPPAPPAEYVLSGKRAELVPTFSNAEEEAKIVITGLGFFMGREREDVIEGESGCCVVEEMGALYSVVRSSGDFG
ncbi:hypothetical protein AMTR_s00083p00144590 [Amborella trichopoda]|uniref:Uncharacterized protein n=1 Tax=Amborella trichopoda TaxID=13333 RepID=W1P4F1_AMBTC|nr:hypothetical protein AMTR_s00083p00144590 [Amborella trichopoda]